MVSYLNELLDRVVSIQKEAMLSIGVNADAWPYFYRTSDGFPYFTNRLASLPITDDGSQDEDINSPIIIMRLVAAHLTEGYRGEPERRLYEWIPVVKTVFNQRQWLTSNDYPERMDDLQSARIINGGAFSVRENDGVNAVQVCAELQLQCIFAEFIEQDQY